LATELQNLAKEQPNSRGYASQVAKLEWDNYRLKSDVDCLKELLKDRNQQITELKNSTPKEIIKEVVVEKPVEVRVEVPKYIPGP
jgi:hypothetical protein